MTETVRIRLLQTGLCVLLAVFPLSSFPDDEGAGRSEWVNACTDWDDWYKTGPPFRIHGDSWYVGTCGIAAILVAGDAGHILIDGGTTAATDLIAANIGALGFRVEDVRVLL